MRHESTVEFCPFCGTWQPVSFMHRRFLSHTAREAPARDCPGSGLYLTEAIRMAMEAKEEANG